MNADYVYMLKTSYLHAKTFVWPTMAIEKFSGANVLRSLSMRCQSLCFTDAFLRFTPMLISRMLSLLLFFAQNFIS